MREQPLTRYEDELPWAKGAIAPNRSKWSKPVRRQARDLTKVDQAARRPEMQKFRNKSAAHCGAKRNPVARSLAAPRFAPRKVANRRPAIRGNKYPLPDFG
jgi:hypothetical protein